MRELLVIVFIVAVIAIVWYLRQQSAAANEQRKVDEFRRLQAKAIEADRAAPAVARGGLLQDAADRAAGKPFEAATDRLETLTDDLAAARRDADLAAQRLAGQASEALASIEVAAAAHGGAIPGDGTPDCPADYPIKGNQPSMRYHTPGQPSYKRTIPEVCFESAAAAEAAGYTESGDEAAMP